jgi:hypothetical protein
MNNSGVKYFMPCAPCSPSFRKKYGRQAVATSV